ncbi:MAG: class I SAM-dependent methyltransferase [Candidatus Dormibacteraeota bacterium]|nr:class I SAM-dependent methyltransferase [Candidatus Dormibacteraeota bacterium]
MTLSACELGFLTEALAASAAVGSAEQLGVLDRLARGPVDAASLARDCALSQRGTRLLLSALASLGLIRAAGGGAFRLSEPDLAMLVRQLAVWDRLSNAIRNDHSVVAVETPSSAEAVCQDVVPHLARLDGYLPDHFADLVGDAAVRILDAGAGAAPWSLVLAMRNPQCLVTAVDRPEVLESTRRAAGDAGHQAQFRFLAGDLFEFDFGEDYDLIIAANLCHLLEPGANGRLLSRLGQALIPRGRLAIVDVLLAESLDRPRASALYALSLALHTRASRVYTFSTFAAWLRDAGFVSIEHWPLGGSPPLSLITARRPD